MSLFKKKASAEFDDQEKENPGKNKGALLVLLILVGGFAYLYLFTSLIVPHEAPPEIAPVGSPEVKQSMPPKAVVQPPGVVPAAQEVKKTDGAKPVAAVPPVAPVVVVPKAAPAAHQPQAAAKPVTAPPAPPAAKPATAPVAPPAATPATPPPASAAAKKEAVAPVKKAEVKPAKPAPQAIKKEAPKAAKAAAAAPVKPVAKKKLESFTLFAGEFPAGDEAADAEAKLVRLGVKPVVKQEMKKSRNMHRLYSGTYSDYDTYAAALDNLKQAAKGAFGVEKDGKYYLYAGSFSTKERAEKEQRDLAAKGLTLKVQQVALSLATVRITAGQFSAKADADRAATKMKGEGLAVKVVSKGK